MNELELTTANPFVILLCLVFYGWWTIVGLRSLFQLTCGKYPRESIEYIEAHRLMCEALALGIGSLLLVLNAQFKLHLLWLGVASIFFFWCGLRFHLFLKEKRT
jgi:hypothetical protein